MKTLARLISVTAAAAVVLLTVLYPRAIAHDGAHVPHGWFVVMMLGMSFAWVYGFGFVPRNRFLKTLFSPWIAWPLLAVGAWGVFLR